MRAQRVGRQHVEVGPEQRRRDREAARLAAAERVAVGDARPEAGMRGEAAPHLGRPSVPASTCARRAAAPARSGGVVDALDDRRLQLRHALDAVQLLHQARARWPLEPSSDVPSGASRCTVHSPMSSVGTNVRPTIAFKRKRRQEHGHGDADDRDRMVERPVQRARVEAVEAVEEAALLGLVVLAPRRPGSGSASSASASA